jgi:hypothetical protein
VAETELRAVMQRPFAAIFEDRAQAAAWKSLPSWAVVATSDNAIHLDAERRTPRGAGRPPTAPGPQASGSVRVRSAAPIVPRR